MDHGTWMALAATEYDRLTALLRGLAPDEWRRPTECTGWDVHAMVSHLVGAAEATASIREFLRQSRLAKPLTGSEGRTLVDGMNDVQIRERVDASPEELIDALAEAGRRGVSSRSRIPAPIRALRVPFGPPLGTQSVAYLMDRIYTRDAWMHRVDIARAVGQDLVVTPEHDGRIVADVVDEWARLHGRPYALLLTGPAGGSWRRGDGPAIELDAVQFCRILSGRHSAGGLLSQRVEF